MRWLFVAAWLLIGSVRPAWAGGLIVQVTDGHAHPVGDAVVTLSAERPPAATNAAPATHYVDQKNETFIPYVQVVKPGDRVVFRNSDSTRHHVYSFSPAKAFEFMLRPGESSPALPLLTAGIIAVGCNIHDHMIAYLVVSGETAQVTGRQGRVLFEHLPPGRYTVRIWHPQLKPGGVQPSAVAVVGAAADPQSVSFALSLMPDPRGFVDREHLDY